MKADLNEREAAALRVHAQECARIAGEYLLVDAERLFLRDRRPAVAEARQLVWTHLVTVDRLPITAVAALFDRDHSTVSHGVQLIGSRVRSQRYLREALSALPRYSSPVLRAVPVPTPQQPESLEDVPVAVLQEQLERTLAYSARLAAAIASRLGIEKAAQCRWLGCGSALDERDFCIEQSHDNRESALRLVDQAVTA